MSKIENIIKESIATKEKLLHNESFLSNVQEIVDVMVKSLRNDGKILFCGNGGSAADAQHLAAELSGRFYVDRDPLFAEALHVNTSYLTAVANDYSYEQIYSRAVKGKGKAGDVLVGISTSGNSKNIVEALKVARELKITTVGFTGESGGKMKDLCDILIAIPSTDTPRIQECHILTGHIICQLVEEKYFEFENA